MVAVNNHELCIHCGGCVGVCPTGAITLEELTRNKGILYDAVVVETGLKLYTPDLSVSQVDASGLTPTAVTHPQYSALPTDVTPAQPGSLPGGGYPWFGNFGAEYVPVSPRRVGRNS